EVFIIIRRWHKCRKIFFAAGFGYTVVDFCKEWVQYSFMDCTFYNQSDGEGTVGHQIPCCNVRRVAHIIHYFPDASFCIRTYSLMVFDNRSEEHTSELQSRFDI